MDIQIMQSSVAAPSTQTVVLESSSIGSALGQLAKNSNNNATQSAGTYGQRTLSHVDHPDNLHHIHEQSSLSQQSATIYTNTQEPHTVVIPQPLNSPIQHQSQGLPSSILDTSFQLHTHDSSQDLSLRRQLESLATEQFISHQLPVELSTTVSGSDSGVTEGEFQPIPTGTE